MKFTFPRFALTAATLMACGLGHANVSLTIDYGVLTNTQSATLPSETLWAIIGQDSQGNLPGGLAPNSGLSSNPNLAIASADFAGAVIAPGNTVGGGRVVATGGSLDSGIVGGFATNIDFAALGLNANDRIGFYWFPNLTLSSFTVPSSGPFEVGAFQQDEPSVASGGNVGMRVPAAGDYALAYYDSVTMGGATPYSPSLFQAVMIPEPSTSFLLIASALLLSRRRR